MFFKNILEKDLLQQATLECFSEQKIIELKKIFRDDFSFFKKLPPAFKLNVNVLAAAIEVNSSFLHQSDCKNLYTKIIAKIRKEPELMKVFLKWDLYRFKNSFIELYGKDKEFVTECLADNWCLSPFLAEAGLLTEKHTDILHEYAVCRQELVENNIFNWQRFADLKTARLILDNIKKAKNQTFVKSGPVVQLLFSREDWLAKDVVKRQINAFLDQGCAVFYHEITASLNELKEAQLLVGSFLPVDLRVLGGSGRKSNIIFNTSNFIYHGTEPFDYSKELSARSLVVLASCFTGTLMKKNLQQRYPMSRVKAPLNEIYDVEYYFTENGLPRVTFKGV